EALVSTLRSGRAPPQGRREAGDEPEGRTLTATRQPDPLTPVLSTFRKPEATDFADAWVGLEPTFQTAKSIRKWRKMSKTPEGEAAYFDDPYMLKTQRKVARAIKDKYERWRGDKQHPFCMF